MTNIVGSHAFNLQKRDSYHIEKIWENSDLYYEKFVTNDSQEAFY